MSIDYYREYGKVYEFPGFSDLSLDACSALDDALLKEALAGRYSVGGSLASGHVEVVGDRNTGFPDVYLEVSGERRLYACNLGPATRNAWKLVQRVIQREAKLAAAPMP